MRADAQKNYDHLLVVARNLVDEQGADASLRDIARRAKVGLGTLYRHFPTREALLEALLRKSIDDLTAKADQFDASVSPTEALVSWLHEAVAVAKTYNGVAVTMMAALANRESALHESCTRVRAAVTRLLDRAQSSTSIRSDIDGLDLFALVSAFAWLGGQPSFTSNADRLFQTVVGALVQESA